MFATQKIIKMSEFEVKLKLISILGSIHAVIDAKNSPNEREYALQCLIDNCYPLINDLHQDIEKFNSDLTQ